MRVEVYVLVGVSGLAEDIKGEGSIAVALNLDVKHVDAAVDFLLFGPFDVGVLCVDVVEESIYVVLVNGYECVVGLAEPEED